MIFSIEMMSSSDHHVFYLFEKSNCILCPSKLLLSSILVSLKMKKAVIIHETPNIPLINIESSKRWEVHDNWIWIDARAFGPLSKHFKQTPTSYQDLKSFLLVNK